MTTDDNTPEPQDTPDSAGPQDFDDTATTPTPTESPAMSAAAIPPKRRKALTRPWTLVGIAAAALLLGGGVFVTGVVAGKSLGDQHESHREHEVSNAQSAKLDKSEGDDADEDTNQKEASQQEAPANAQPDEPTPAAKTPAMTAPTPSVVVATPPVNTQLAPTTR